MSIQQAVGGSAVTATSTNNKTGRIAGIKTSSIASGLVSGLNPGANSVFTGNYPIDGAQTDKAISAGTFGYLGNTRGVIKRYSELIAGVSNTVLRSGGAKVRRSIHQILSISTNRTATAIRAGYFNVLTGGFTTPPTVATDSLGSRDDATLNSTIQFGEFSYRDGSPTVQSDDYSTRYLW